MLVNFVFFFFRNFNDNREGDLYLDWRAGLVSICSTRLSDVDTPVPKHVGFDTCELCFMIYILLSAFVC
jgi:hypothetical protein